MVVPRIAKMTPERWNRIESVLQTALDLSPAERDAYLAKECKGDAVLSAEVSSLIAAYYDSKQFIEDPALTTDAEFVFQLYENTIGHEVGPYQLIERLGSGGMGEVYLARDQRLNRSVALKILPEFLSDEVRLNRFRKEARAASALNHPNIITIHEVGEFEGTRYIATEFIQGKTLRQLLDQNDLSITTALSIAEQVCVALKAAHSEGIVHRDIKPENIMLRPDGIVKLLDFGIAKLIEQSAELSTQTYTQTEIGLIVGTVSYMSPEQARGLTVDERTDIWSLGVVLYEMLAGRLPFAEATRLDTMVAILERQPQPIRMNRNSGMESLEDVVNKCLAKDADARYQTADQLMNALRTIRPVSDSPAPISSLVSDNAELPSKGRKLHSAALFTLVLLTVITLGTFYFYKGRSNSVTPELSAPAAQLYSQMTEAEQLAFIDQQEQRISALMGERPAKLSKDALQAIKKNVDRYVSRGEKAGEDSLSVVFGRAHPYLKTIGRSFRDRNVPVIVGIYLPMVESEYKACMERETGAKGLFQFLPGTAAQYGVSEDEMCVAEKMTPAAAHYIADRMAELGDDAESLTLVLVSFTTGAEWVRSTLRQLRESGNYERNFWTMFEKRDTLGRVFQKNTVDYVPTFFAAAIIGENPATFGLTTPPLTTLAE
jgi:serine/threonine protein kinase